ncbi:MAG: phosphotransferase family protein [Dehalococcoidia bacterium]|nr:MAG: phosphotransferase family protein [Dehalococcoidia bacterium]
MRPASGALAVDVTGLRRLTGGASRETWSLDATLHFADRDDELPLILQRDTRGGRPTIPRALEFRLIAAAYEAGVPVPEPLFLGDDSLGGEFFIVRRLDGETLPRRLLREDVYADAREQLPAQLGAALARIHAIDVAASGLDALPAPPDGVSPAAFELGRYEQIFRAIALEPHPAFELAFRWLGRQLAAQQTAKSKQQNAAEPRALVHGDYRMGNVLFGPEGLRLVLDWELAHVGDPMEDLAWICVRSWRFGGAKPVGGIGEREAFFAAYEAAGGRKVDPDWVRWWEVFGNLRWGIICLSQARTYIDGISKSVELASIGRRTAETEWELLELVDS